MRTLLCCLMLLSLSAAGALAQEKDPAEAKSETDVEMARQERREQLSRRKTWPENPVDTLEAIDVSMKVGSMNWCEAKVDDPKKKQSYAAARATGKKALERAVEQKLLAQIEVDQWIEQSSKERKLGRPLDAARCDLLASELQALSPPTSSPASERPAESPSD